jgi:hypothetical protein
MTPRVTIVMEYENAATHNGDEAAPVFASLFRQFSGRGSPPRAADRDELILVFDPARQDGGDIDRVIDSAAPGLVEWLDIAKLPRPGLRYYELKNAGAEVARGEILVFLDSDLEPEDGWLDVLLGPFAESGTIAVNGHTYLGHSDFMSRVFALAWVFPLRDDDEHEMRRRSLNANNCAFRREWFARHPFPYHPGFKVSCSLLAAQMRKQGIDLVRAPAFTRHKPLEGWRFVLWRAAITGRDDDARYVTMRTDRRSRRLGRALSRWVNGTTRAFRRIATRHRAVGMPGYQVPAAWLAAAIYFAVAFASQVISVFSAPRNAPERIPSFVERRW